MVGRRTRIPSVVVPCIILWSGCGEATAPGSIPAPGSRSTADRPDDIEGSQIHLVYAVCSVACTDRGMDTTGVIENSLAVLQAWLEERTGGRRLRIDTYDGRPDITFFRMDGSDWDLRFRSSRLVNDIWDQMAARGFRAGAKRYLVYYDGLNSQAASAQFGLAAAALYLRRQPRFRASGSPGRAEFAALHETLHMLGYVDPDAPNHADDNGFHVSDDPRDVMYGDFGWSPSVLDVGNDDYFGDRLPFGVRNFADSPFLTPGR